ncbi:hypothetical protein ElyMa_005075600 [Elysia marginata]|uniref:TNFR-Cys domain-containing protein n=1 Tax=Elysia marginata TaxID=1093978 RepID=A0AAV4JFM4_9GAST|nr:hypothetical protein ElyMa_005075600 [Elysia marginata]
MPGNAQRLSCDFLCLGLVLLAQAIYLADAVGLSPTQEDGKMIVIFNRKYELIFPEIHLKEFYDCLCNKEAITCRFEFKTSADDDAYIVTKTSGEKWSSHSSIQTADTMVCRTQQLSREFICDKEYAVEKCNSEGGTSSLHKLEFYGSSCRACINLCWQGFTVSYNSTSTRALPSEGACKSSSLGLSMFPETRESEKPVMSVSEFIGEEFTPTLVVEGLSVFESNPSLETTENGTSSTAVSLNITESEVRESREKLDPHLPEIVWVGLGCTTFLMIAIACVLYFTRRSEERKERDSDSKRPFFIQPLSEFEERSSIGNLVEASLPMSDFGHNVFTVTRREHPIYTSSAGVYCTIADSDMMAARLSDRNRFDNYDSSVQLQGYRSSLSSRTEAKVADTTRSCATITNNTYSQPRKGPVSMKSAADAPRNMVQANRPITAELDSGIDEDEGGGIGRFYCRLNSHTEILSDIQVTAPETYDVAGAVFEKSANRQCSLRRPSVISNSKDVYRLATLPRDIGEVLAEGDKGSEAKAPAVCDINFGGVDRVHSERNVDYFTLENGKDGDIVSEDEAPALCDNCYGGEERVHCGQIVDYFTLENGKNVNVLDPCSSVCLEEQPRSAYFQLEGGLSNFEECRMDGSNVNIDSMAGQTGYYSLEENAGNYYEELKSTHVSGDQEVFDTVLNNDHHEQEYFELETHAEEERGFSEVGDQNCNAEECHGGSVGDGSNLDSSHIYQEIK